MQKMASSLKGAAKKIKGLAAKFKFRTLQDAIQPHKQL